MPWVRFTAPFDFKPKPAVTIAYAVGYAGNVTRDCAAAAKAAGAAVGIKGRNDGSGKNARASGVPGAASG